MALKEHGRMPTVDEIPFDFRNASDKWTQLKVPTLVIAGALKWKAVHSVSEMLAGRELLSLIHYI